MSTTTKSSGRKTADATIANGAAILCGVLIETDQTNDATVIVYDNTAASGTVLFKAIVPGAEDTRYFELPRVKATTGLYADVTGTGAAYIIHYS